MSFGIEWIGNVPASNFTVGRGGNPVSILVDHWVGAGTLEQAIAHFRDPASRVSAHFLVGTAGRIVQMLDTNDTGYHCGNYVVNELSIGIEHEATPTLLPTEAMYAASAWLHRHLSGMFNITLEVGKTVKPHSAIVPTTCPGTLDIPRIVKGALMPNPTDPVTHAELDQYKALLQQQLDATYAKKDHSHTATTTVT